MPRSSITTRYRSCNNCPPAWRASISCAFWGSATRQINDNLVNGLIYHVRKVNAASKECMEQQVLSFQQEGNESVERIGQILSMFLDDSIADSVPFGEVKRRAFGILERAKFTRAAEYIGAHVFDTTAIEWEFVASFALSFKQHLRPLLLQLPFAAHSEDDHLDGGGRVSETVLRQWQEPQPVQLRSDAEGIHPSRG